MKARLRLVAGILPWMGAGLLLWGAVYLVRGTAAYNPLLVVAAVFWVGVLVLWARRGSAFERRQRGEREEST